MNSLKHEIQGLSSEFRQCIVTYVCTNMQDFCPDPDYQLRFLLPLVMGEIQILKKGGHPCTSSPWDHRTAGRFQSCSKICTIPHGVVHEHLMGNISCLLLVFTLFLVKSETNRQPQGNLPCLTTVPLALQGISHKLYPSPLQDLQHRPQSIATPYCCFLRPYCFAPNPSQRGEKTSAISTGED